MPEMRSGRAIVIPYNPHVDLEGGTAAGSLIAHKNFADKIGAVYWDLINATSHSDIEAAYFYDPAEGVVTHRSTVVLMEKKDDLNDKEEKFVPNWRRMVWEPEQLAGQVWVKLKDIFPLKDKHKLSDFKKVVDGRPLKGVRNYAVVEDPAWATESMRFSLSEFIDDYIYRLMSQGSEKLRESDIEEILWHQMMERNLEFVSRQEGRENRLDVAFRHGKDFVIVEIKKDTAGLDTLEQIKGYMKKTKTEREAEKVFGIILCRKADLRLREAAKKEDKIEIDEFRFSVEFPRIKEILDKYRMP